MGVTETLDRLGFVLLQPLWFVARVNPLAVEILLRGASDDLNALFLDRMCLSRRPAWRQSEREGAEEHF